MDKSFVIFFSMKFGGLMQNTYIWKKEKVGIFSLIPQVKVDPIFKLFLSVHFLSWSKSKIWSNDHCFSIAIAWQILALNQHFIFLWANCSDILGHMLYKCFFAISVADPGVRTGGACPPPLPPPPLPINKVQTRTRKITSNPRIARLAAFLYVVRSMLGSPGPLWQVFQ